MTIREQLEKIINQLGIITSLLMPKSATKDNAIVTALLQCESIQRDLESIKADLPIEISSRVNDSDSELVQVKELVRACTQYNALQILIDAVKFYEGDSLAFREVLSLVNSK
jgi:hypothetical protein